jgi:hypothetical protein
MVEAVLAGGVDTSRLLVRETCLRLGRVGARILGGILNRVDVVSNSYHLYDHYSYYQSNKPRKAAKPKAAGRQGFLRYALAVDAPRFRCR